ncbi:MFS transporter [Lentzea sp.]|uniref:MFS transporter n=1 Tax=Lentzea sp. TaxID=56099 RepID=UPI002ED2F87E
MLFIARGLSQVGTSLQVIAQSLAIVSMPGGDRLVAVVAVVPTAAVVLLSGVGGSLADRFSPRAVLLSTQPMLALIALSMGVAGQAGVLGAGRLITGVVVLNLVASLGTAAWQVLISDATGGVEIRQGTTINTAALDAGLIVGAVLAAPVIAMSGSSGAFILNGASYLVTTLTVAALRGAAGSCETTVVRGERVTARHVFGRLLGTWETSAVVLTAMAAALVGTSLPVLLLLLVHQERATDGAVYGAFLGAMSAGSLVGGIVTWQHISTARRVLGEAIGLGLLVLAVACMPGTASTLVVLVPVGFLFLTLRVGVVSYVQLRAPAGGRARTVALFSLVLAGAQIIGTTGFTMLAAEIGARWSIAAAGLLLVIMVSAVLAWAARRRRPPVHPSSTSFNSDRTASSWR